MTEIQKHLKDREARKQIARTVKRRLTIVVSFLIGMLLGLIFKIGETIWPIWITDHRTQVAGVTLLAIILLILLSPVIIENSSNPRALSGPGKNPEGPRLG
jgi:hypothetical protein